MRRNEPITHIMSKNPVSVQVGQKLSDVRKLMAEHLFHHVPVVDGTKLVGLFSASDLVRLSFGAGATDSASLDAVMDHTWNLADVMHKNPNSLSDGDTVRHAAELLVSGSFHSVPIVNGDGDLVGMVTSTDLIRYLLEQY